MLFVFVLCFGSEFVSSTFLEPFRAWEKHITTTILGLSVCVWWTGGGKRELEGETNRAVD